MRYLIFSDIHGNLEALDVVLRFVQKRRVDLHELALGRQPGEGRDEEVGDEDAGAQDVTVLWLRGRAHGILPEAP